MNRKTFLSTCLFALSTPFTGISSIFEKKDKWNKGKYSFYYEEVIYKETMLYGVPLFTLTTKNKDITFGLDYVTNRWCPLPGISKNGLSCNSNGFATKSEVCLLDDKKYKIKNWQCNSELKQIEFEIV